MKLPRLKSILPVKKSLEVVEEYRGFQLVRDTDLGVLVIMLHGKDTGSKPPIKRDGWKRRVDHMMTGKPPTTGPGAYDARGNRR